MAAMNIVLDIPSREEPFEPLDMPDLVTLLPLAEWHDQTATELAGSGSDLAPFHRYAARCLRAFNYPQISAQRWHPIRCR
jgi:hypothetical protein